ncbi:MAG: hypothetical protein FWG20_03110 [Candidatus Cloacimonetes bacterium]|nr:hypothetical protein [Candidatus Cloacimonadota bacterium]
MCKPVVRDSYFLLKTLCLLLLLLTICNLHANLDIRLRATAEYDSNVFSLSDYDFDRFKEARAFEYIETSDDFKQKFDIRVSSQAIYRDIKITPFAEYSFTNYMNNADKNLWNVLLGAAVVKDKFTVNGAYGYYPDTYLRKYFDTDGTTFNEKYIYDKMMWRVSSSYRYHSYVIPLLYAKYEQYHHNQYFTENDGGAFTGGVGWRVMTRYVNADMMYYLRTFKASSDDDKIKYIIDNVKDASYEANIYELKLRTKRFYHTLSDFRIYSNLKYEDRYFQSRIPLAIDLYHTSRNDKITTLNTGVDLWLTKAFSLKLDYQYRTRKSTSDYPAVSRDKDFDKYQLSTMLEYNINIF